MFKRKLIAGACALLMALSVVAVTPQTVRAETDEAAIRSFVTGLYRTILGREPEEEGLQAWTGVLSRHETTGAQVVYDFVNSQEFRNNPLSTEEFVRALYLAILGREPDEDGFWSWCRVADEGEGRDHVIDGFVHSAEMKNLCDAMGVDAVASGTRLAAPAAQAEQAEEPETQQAPEQTSSYVDEHSDAAAFVTRLYKYCLDRNPDAAGLEGWVRAVVTGSNTGVEVALGFFESQELKNQNLSDEDFLEIAYNALLNRGPDAEGRDAWLKTLKTRSRSHVLAGFLNSAEFGNLCSQYGITCGEADDDSDTAAVEEKSYDTDGEQKEEPEASEQVPDVEPEKEEETTQAEETQAEEEHDEDDGWVYLGKFKITAYCPCRTCNGNSSGLTYSGVPLDVGTTIAVDRRVISLGTEVKIDGVGVRIAQDTGVYGNTIDLLVSSHSGAYDWGVRYRDVWVKAD